MINTRDEAYPAPIDGHTAEKLSTAIIWFSLALLPLIGLISTVVDVSHALNVLAVAFFTGGFAIFVTNGGRRLTAAGIYCLTVGLMTGGACWYWASRAPNATDRASILLAAMSLYVSTALMYAIFWRRTAAQTEVDRQPSPPIAPERARSMMVVGLLMFATGAFAKGAGATLGTLAQSTAEVGAILFAASLLLSGGVRVVHTPIRAAAICVILVAFYVIVFSGGGRLRLVTVLIAIAVIAQHRLRTHIKLLAVIALLPTIILFGSIGQTRYAAQALNPNYEAPASGLGSLVNPLATYAQLIDQQITGGHGATFVAESVALIPRGMWTGKPVQFGQIMVQRLHPELAGQSDLSIPALDAGEWFYNFSWLGLILMIPVSGLGIRWIDRQIERRKIFSRPQDVYFFVVLAILVGSISDLAWGGLSTWEVRNAQRLLVLIPILAWYCWPMSHGGPVRATLLGDRYVGGIGGPVEGQRPASDV